MYIHYYILFFAVNHSVIEFIVAWDYSATTRTEVIRQEECKTSMIKNGVDFDMYRE